MATATTPEVLMTAEELARRPDTGVPEELVRGKIVALTVPGARHGQICAEVVQTLGNHAEEHDAGHVLCNDSGVITARNPDTVRGADVAFYSYARIPKGPLPANYPGVMPELVVEVRSPSERWANVVKKVAEYLDAGVGVVCVLDDQTRTAQVYESDQPVRIVTDSDDLAFPEILPGFGVALSRFFE